MVYTLLRSATVRAGQAEIKKAGLSSLKGWKQRWLVLNPTTLIAYKNTTEPEIMFTLAVESLKQVECVNLSKARSRCLHLITYEGSQYYLSFRTTSELYGWREDLDAITLSPVPRKRYAVTEETGEAYNTNLSSGALLESDSSKQKHYHTKSQSCFASRPPRVEHTLRPVRSTPNLTLPSPEITYTEVSRHNAQVPKNARVLTPYQRTQIRRAILILCEGMEPRMLRTSDPGGEKPFDLVEVRLRPLLRLQRKWKKVDVADLDEETKNTFSQALKDGVVLCQYINTLHSNPVIRPDPREAVNIGKFLAQCIDDGLSADELFMQGDVAAATNNSLTRVARTIIALDKTADASTSRKANIQALVKFSKDGLAKRTKSPPETSCIETWVDRYIASRSAESSVRYDVDSSSARAGYSQLPKVYKNLAFFVTEMTRNQVDGRASLYRTLNKLMAFMTSLDLVSSLVESAQFRIRLLQISAELKVSDNRLLREALQKDDNEIAHLLRNVLTFQECKETILALQGQDAQGCIDLLQDVLDKGCLKEDADFSHSAGRLLVKLSEAQNILPSSLFIKGIKREEAEARCGGTFGDIFKALYKGQDVALKRIRIFQRDIGQQKMRRKFCREALLWQRLRHPFVQPFCGIDSESFPSFLCMVSPWMRHGTILKHLSEHGYTNIEARLLEIAQGLAYLHSQKIIHGDLRGSNILVDEEWHVRLADFGLAVFSDVTITTQNSHHGGSVRWMAPELHHPSAFGLKHFRRTFETDVYAFACVCIELYTGKPPFAELPHDPAAMLRVLAGERPARPLDAMGRDMPDYVWHIIQLCWNQDPKERPNITRVIEMMLAGNADLRLNTDAYTEVIDLDSSLHSENLGRTKLTRSRMFTRARTRPTPGRQTGDRSFRYSPDGKYPNF